MQLKNVTVTLSGGLFCTGTERGRGELFVINKGWMGGWMDVNGWPRFSLSLSLSRMTKRLCSLLLLVVVVVIAVADLASLRRMMLVQQLQRLST